MIRFLKHHAVLNLSAVVVNGRDILDGQQLVTFLKLDECKRDREIERGREKRKRKKIDIEMIPIPMICLEIKQKRCTT